MSIAQQIPMQSGAGRDTFAVRADMQRILIITALLLIASGADAQKNSAQQKMDAYYTCLKSSAARLDDHRSDARTVAGAIYQDCSAEHLAAVRAFSGLDEAAARQVLRGNREADIDRATFIVLHGRKTN